VTQKDVSVIVSGLVAGSMYVRRFFNEEAKEVMLEMFKYLKESFSKDILGGLDWMDEKTKGMITITVKAIVFRFRSIFEELALFVVIKVVNKNLKNATQFDRHWVSIWPF
jgi:hypothetical protein